MASFSDLIIKTHVLEYKPLAKKPPLKVVAESYTIHGNAKHRNAENLTLILTTGIGAGKGAYCFVSCRVYV